MNIQKTIALVTAPVGLLFLVSDMDQLWSIIVATQLDWYKAFQPIALGIILGCFAGLLRLDFVQKATVPVLYLSTALFTFGVIGSLAIYFEHQLWVLALPTLWLAALAVGLYAFMVMQLRFSERYKEAQKKKQEK